MNTSDMENVRAVARMLAQRALTDNSFREQIYADPVEALTTAGLPEQWVVTFLQETQLSEVAGYSMGQECLISNVDFIQDFIH